MPFRPTSWTFLVIFILSCISCAKKDYQQQDFKGLWVLNLQAIEQKIKDPSTSENDSMNTELAKAILHSHMEDYALEITDSHFQYITPGREEVAAYTYTKLSNDTFAIHLGKKEIQLKLTDDTLYVSQKQSKDFIPHRRLTQTERDAFLEAHQKQMARQENGPEPDEPAENQFLWVVNKPDKFAAYYAKNPSVAKIVTEEGENLLHYASKFGEMALARHLIEVLHMDVNASDNEGETPVYKVRLPADQQLGDLLLTNGADIDHLTSKGTKLLSEIKQKNAEGVAYLLDKGADVNRLYKGKYEEGTPIDFAVRTDHLPTIQILLARGADLSEAHTKTSPVLYYAASEASLQVLEYLVANNININVKYDNSYPILQAMFRDDDTLQPTLAVFKSAGVNIDFRDRNGDTLLISAIRSENPEKVKALLALGADPGAYTDSKYSKNETALELAKKSGNEKIIRMMSSSGKNQN